MVILFGIEKIQHPIVDLRVSHKRKPCQFGYLIGFACFQINLLQNQDAIVLEHCIESGLDLI